ncbi:MAG: hypothetical protein ACOCUH_01375 [Bacteriovoracia bacterium]
MIMQRVLNSSFFKIFLLYMGYLFIFGLLHLAILSFVAFFHFLLGHRIPIVEDWLHSHGWVIFIFSKLVAVTIILRIIHQTFHLENPLKGYIHEGLQRFPSKHSFLSMFFLLFFILWWGAPVNNTGKDEILEANVLSFWGVLIFYLSDFLVLSLGRYFFSLKGIIQKILYYTCFPLLFFFISKAVIPYEKDLQIWYAFHLLMCLLFDRLGNYRWIISIMYLLVIVIPLAVLWGINPIYGDNYSLYSLTRSISPLLLVSLSAVSVFYLYWSGRRAC